MMAWTSPALTERLRPFSMFLPSTDACKSLISSIVIIWVSLANAAFEADTKQRLCFDSKFHGQFFENFFTVTIHNHRDRVFRRQATLHGVEQLIFANTRSSGFVLDMSRRILDFHYREGVSCA